MRGIGVLTPLFAIFMVSVAAAQTPPMKPDIPTVKMPTPEFDYERREVMIPMRDGVRLFTVIVVPKGAQRAPIILTRTPYHAANRAKRFMSPHMLATLPQGDEVFVPEGYIRVFQDVRLCHHPPAARAAERYRRRSLHRRLRHHRVAR
jgi:predicted acyl esterase